MSDQRMIMLYKSLRLPFLLGQTILILPAAYLLLTKNESWIYPMSLLYFQQVVFWIGHIYYSKKMNLDDRGKKV